MGAEKIRLPTTPIGWAIHISKMLNAFNAIHGGERFSLDIRNLSIEYSKAVFPEEPITLVEGDNFSGNFEGALVPNPHRQGEWGILYNKAIPSKGRKNFTLAHELGHYFLHRKKTAKSFYCDPRKMLDWNSEYGQIESEANQFASYLLMPLDDFRQQTKTFKRPSIQDFEQIKNRYTVSLTAVILKWLEITSVRAMIVVSKDGFIDWARSSESALKAGIYLKSKQQIYPVPTRSVTSGHYGVQKSEVGRQIPKGIWRKNETVFESAIFAEYHELVITLIVFNDDTNEVAFLPNEYREPTLFDSYDQFLRNS